MKRLLNQKFDLGKCYKNISVRKDYSEFIKVTLEVLGDPHGIIIKNWMYSCVVEIDNYIWHDPKNFKEISEEEFISAKTMQ